MKVLLSIVVMMLTVGSVQGLAQAREFTPVEHPDFVADYYPGDTSGRYGVMVLGGAEGGKPSELAQRLAAFGYPVLAVAYFKSPGLPAELEAIPLEYFSAPRAWLAAQPTSRSDAVLVAGWSKGAELALLLSANQAGYAGVLAIAPSHVVWAGILADWRKVPQSSWTLGGKPLSHVPFQGGEGVEGLFALYAHSLKNTAAVTAARIPVEKIQAPVLLLSGGKDAIWPAPVMADKICAQMGAQACTHKHFPDAGHLLTVDTELGGTLAANTQAQKEADRAMADFLQQLNQ